ncbi:MAG: DUF4340 domain-containing protein, partial [Lentisphaerae bacterium]|nr:DUF4340 domain-containing protein [Lentisphaerota bacterium]
SPIRARADQGQIDRILSVLAASPREDVVPLSSLADRGVGLKDYGLTKPRVRIRVGTRLRKEEILVGYDAPLGDSLYVMLRSTDEIIATWKQLADIVPVSVEQIRDRTVLHGDAGLTTRLEIQRKGAAFVQLARTEKGWFIQQPIVARAAAARVMALLDAVYAARVMDFVWDAPTDNGASGAAAIEEAAAKIEAYHLAPDEAEVRISLRMEGDELGKELLLGKSMGEGADRVYAKFTDVDSIFTVRQPLMDLLTPEIEVLRDRDLFAFAPEEIGYVYLEAGGNKLVLTLDSRSGWRIREPVQWKADDKVVRSMLQAVSRARVESFMDETLSELADLGLDRPSVIAQFLPEDPGTEPAPLRTGNGDPGQPEEDMRCCLMVGNRVADAGTAYAKFRDAPSVYIVSQQILNDLGSDPVDPLAYRDRTMLTVQPENVRRIRLVRGGAEQTVVRDESGVWVTDPPGGVVLAGVVDDILFDAANLRALRTEAYNPENLSPYGLDHPDLVLTLGLAGEEGIRKSLLMGFRSRTDGIFAMIKGSDVVFVLPGAVVDSLVRDLAEPARPERLGDGVTKGVSP